MSETYLGERTPGDSGDLLTAITFIARSLMGQAWTATLVKVVAVHGGGVDSGPPQVDVQPLVNQLDGFSQPTPHGTVTRLPCARIQAGMAAIVCDPLVGDIGLAVFASHDITAVLATGQQSNPGSRRRFDPSDGMYVLTLIGAAPTQLALQISASGVEILGDNGNLWVEGNLGSGNGVSGMFPTLTGQTVTVTNGVITNIF